MSTEDDLRKLANQLVKESTVDGKLDLRALRINTKHALEQNGSPLRKDPDYATHKAEGSVSVLMDEYMDKMAVATREVLGVIPESQWKNRGDKKFKPDHGMAIAQEPAKHDPKKALGEQGYVFLDADDVKLTELMAKQIGTKVKAAQAASSPEGASISAAEKKTIEKSMQVLLNSGEEEPLLNNKAKADVRAVLDTLKKAGITTSDKVLGNEIKELSGLAPATTPGKKPEALADRGRG